MCHCLLLVFLYTLFLLFLLFFSRQFSVKNNQKKKRHSQSVIKLGNVINLHECYLNPTRALYDKRKRS